MLAGGQHRSSIPHVHARSSGALPSPLLECSTLLGNVHLHGRGGCTAPILGSAVCLVAVTRLVPTRQGLRVVELSMGLLVLVVATVVVTVVVRCWLLPILPSPYRLARRLRQRGALPLLAQTFDGLLYSHGVCIPPILLWHHISTQQVLQGVLSRPPLHKLHFLLRSRVNEGPD